MLQARQLGKELYVGVHSDEEILANKGPTVMKLMRELLLLKHVNGPQRQLPTHHMLLIPNLWMNMGVHMLFMETI